MKVRGYQKQGKYGKLIAVFCGKLIAKIYGKVLAVYTRPKIYTFSIILNHDLLYSTRYGRSNNSKLRNYVDYYSANPY